MQVLAEKNIQSSVFTDEMRSKLGNRISELKLPHRVVARYFGVSECTLHNWLYGKTRLRNPRILSLIDDFLTGGLNLELEQSRYQYSGDKFHGNSPYLPDALLHYQRCYGRRCHRDYVNYLERLIEDSIGSLIVTLCPRSNSLELIQSLLHSRRR